MQMYLYAMLAASSIGFASGSYFLKRYADLGDWNNLGAAFSIFALSNLIYARVLAVGLGQGAVLSSMAHLILMCMLGATVFNERFGERQILGLMLAISAAWMFTGEKNSS